LSGADPGPKKPCCLISEMLEEAGLNRERARQLRRQILEGIVLLCQWQLERMETSRPAPSPGRRARRVSVD
jgi:hypothetical protein